ncbi:hypothetical protein Tco_1462066, partial [Tanacetum coccineum]
LIPWGDSGLGYIAKELSSSQDQPTAEMGGVGYHDKPIYRNMGYVCTILGGSEAQIRLNLLLPVLVYAARHTHPTVRQKLMLPDITYYCWASAKAKIVNGEQQIQALVDKKKVIITETSIRSDLKLDDAEGIECLPNALIFAKLERIGKESGPTEPVTDEAHVSTPSYDQPQSGEDEKVKTAQAKEITSLKKRVKQLEKRRKSRPSGLRRLRKVGSTSRVESSNNASLGAQEDAYK